MSEDIPCKREHLTKEWLQTILDAQNEGITVEEVVLEDGSKKGDNFSAEIIKVGIKGKKNGEPHSTSLFVKMASADGSVGNKTLDVPIFPTEVEAYGKVFPDMIAAQPQEKKVPLPVARCYLAARHERSGIIVMEDLKASGYNLANFFNGQTLDECQVVMINMAKLHAAGYNLKLKKKEEMKTVYPHLFSNSWWRNRNKQETLLELGVKAAAAIIGDLEGYKDKGKRIEQKATYLSKRAVEGMGNEPDHKLSTVCQGDIWSNNMLFKYDNGKAMDVKLLDFEFLCFYLPVMDLVDYFYTSTLPEFRKKHLRELLGLYHEQLFHYLATFGVTEISADDLSVEWLWSEFHSERCLFGISFALTSIPMILALAEKIYNQDNKTALEGMTAAFKDSQSKDPRKYPFIMQRIAGLMEEMEQRGII